VNVAGPAGALVSTARDMSRWMMWHLSGGTVPPTASGAPRPPARRLIDKDLLWETYRARNPALSRHFNDQLTTTNATDRHVAYDLGWMTSYYRGKLIYTDVHSGPKSKPPTELLGLNGTRYAVHKIFS